MFKKTALAAILSLAGSGAIFAQGVPVVDATAIATQKTAFAQQIAQLIKEYEQAVTMYEAVNGVTDMHEVAALLNDPSVREILGQDVQSIASAFDFDLSDLESLSGAAQAAYDHSGLSGADRSADDFYQNELDRVRRQSGRNAAVGERLVDLSDERLQGLEGLRQQIGQVETQKEVDALNARIAIETAMLQNDAIRVQGLQMLSDAQMQAEEQRQATIAAEQREVDRAGFISLFGQP